MFCQNKSIECWNCSPCRIYCRPICCPIKGEKGDKGDAGPIVIANIDFILIPVATQNQINVLSNDLIPFGINNVIISAPPSISEGTTTFVGSPVNGVILFTPAPRLLTNASFGYQVTLSNNITVSAMVKVNVDTTYSGIPKMLFINASTQINMVDINTGTFSNIATLQNAATEIASNIGDALIYYGTAAVGNNDIFAHDYILNTDFLLLNYSILIPSTVQVSALGFDNKRYFLYLGFESGNDLLKVAVLPYDRYNNPGVQAFSASVIPLPAPVQGLFIVEITVEPETGYLYLSTRPSSGGNTTIYKVDPISSSVINTSAVITGTAHAGFSNDGNLYLLVESGGSIDIYPMDKSTLAIGALISTMTSLVTDISEPLFNM